jgi:phage antirepressor YoqD-like protein
MLMTEKEKEYRRERMVRSLTKCNLLTMGCKTTGQVARQLRMTAKELYRELKERDILYKSDGIWMLTPAYAFRGLLRYRYTLYYTLLGEKKVRVYPVWTEKGLKFLMEEFLDV